MQFNLKGLSNYLATDCAWLVNQYSLKARLSSLHHYVTCFNRPERWRESDEARDTETAESWQHDHLTKHDYELKFELLTN